MDSGLTLEGSTLFPRLAPIPPSHTNVSPASTQLRHFTSLLAPHPPCPAISSVRPTPIPGLSSATTPETLNVSGYGSTQSPGLAHLRPPARQWRKLVRRQAGRHQGHPRESRFTVLPLCCEITYYMAFFACFTCFYKSTFFQRGSR